MDEKEELLRLAQLEELDLLKRIDSCDGNLEVFARTYLSEHTPNTIPEFHKEIYKALGEPNPRTLVIAPRGFAKSTLTSRFFPLYLALFLKARDIIIVSGTVALAKEHLRMIRQELEANEKIIKDFGMQKSEKWTEDHIILQNGSQIRAKGRGFQIRGFRPDVIICDDLEDDEVIYSKEQRDKMEAWFFRTLLPALKPQQRLVYIGTILHQYSLIMKLEQKPEFIVKKYRALTNDKSIWEELFPTEYLKRLRIEMGTYAFESEYQNNPIALENQPIKPEMLDVQKPVHPTKIRVLTVDPAISEKEIADYSAITIVDRTEDNKFPLVAKERGHWGIDALTDRIIELYLLHKPDRVLIEEFAYQKVIRYVLTNKARARNIFIPVSTAFVGREVNGKTDKRPMDKLSRLLQVLPLFEQKLVYIGDEEVKQELLGFPFGDHDDLVDAMVYALYWLMKFQPGAAIKQVDPASSLPTARRTLRLKQMPNGEYVAVHDSLEIKPESNGFINTIRKRQ